MVCIFFKDLHTIILRVQENHVEMNIENDLYGEEDQLHEYWGTLNGDWFGGPNEYFDQIMMDSYAFLYSFSFPYLIGDINTDGIIGIADLLLIYDFILGDLTPYDMQYFLADYDSNGLVNDLDALILINEILNIN